MSSSCPYLGGWASLVGFYTPYALSRSRFLIRFYAAFSSGVGYSLATTSAGSNDLFERDTSLWLTGNWSMTLITNICSTRKFRGSDLTRGI